MIARSRLRLRLVALAGAVALPLAHAAENPSGSPADSAVSVPRESSDATFDSLRTRLRRTTDETLSPEALVFDDVYRDSLRARFDSTVASIGLERAVAGAADPEPRLGSRSNPRWTRVRTSFDPEDVSFRHSKVDGATLLLPARLEVLRRAWSLRTSVRAGYAFGSSLGRYEGEARFGTRFGSVGAHVRRISERFGWTAVHGNRVLSLAGVDEQQYLERRGFDAFVSAPPVDRFRVVADYRNERQSSQRARDVFTLGRPSHLFEKNRAATRGELRALRVSIERPRRTIGDLWGSAFLERAGGSLGGDLRFDRVGLAIGARRPLPWGSDVSLQAAAQAAASPEAVPVQATADLGGRTSLRGYPQLSFVGSHAVLARVDLFLGLDLFRRARIPLLGTQKLQFVPFVDAGSAWTPAGRSLGSAKWPRSDEWKWSAGLGIRKGVGFGEILSHVRVDAAWRLDRDGPTPVFTFVLENEPFN